MAKRTPLTARQLRFPIDTRNRDSLQAKLAEHDVALDALDGEVAAPAVSTVTPQPVVLSAGTITLDIPDAATSTYLFTTPKKIELYDVVVVKDAAGAANTIQVMNGAGVAISDAIAAAVDKTVTRAGTMDKATRVINAGGTFRVIATRAAGSMACQVFIQAVPRA
jgi:hypothetical protein